MQPKVTLTILASSVNSIREFIFDINFAKAMIPDQETMERVEEIFKFRPGDQLSHGNAAEARLIELGIEVGANVSHRSLSNE